MPNFLSQAWVERLGWTLIHSLWQGAIVWVLLECVLYFLRRKAPAVRYLVACFALILTTALPWITFARSDFEERLHPAPFLGMQGVSHSPAANVPAAPVADFTPMKSADWKWVLQSKTRLLLPWIVGVWLTGLVIFILRLWLSWRGVRKLVRQPLLPLPEVWKIRMVELCKLAGVSHLIQAGECVGVTVPMVLGWLKPVILLPIGVLAGIPAWQIEAVLLHELAHIRRHDFAVNLLQTCCETIFFYHPAVWSISRRIREERECACDDLAVFWSSDPTGYATALAAFEEQRGLALGMAVTGEGDLLGRIRRILLGAQPHRRRASFVASAAVLAMAGYLISMFVLPAWAARLMTAEERIAIIEKSKPVEDATVWNSDNKERVSLKGTILTEDGLPLPKDLDAVAMVRSRKSSGFYSVFNDKGTIDQKIPGGRTSLAVWAAGYAPAYVGPMSPQGDALGPVSILLKRGFPARLRLIDQGGRPLAGVSLTGWATHEGVPDLNIRKLETGPDGTVVLGNVVDGIVLHLTASKAGWQTTERFISTWAMGRTESWVLSPAVATTGRIMDANSGEPIRDAEICLAGTIRTGGDVRMESPDSSPVLAHSDGEGRFTLNMLNSDNAYRLYIKHPGYQLTVFPISSGDQDVPMALARGLKLAGWIIDPAKSLPGGSKLEVELSVPITKDASYGYGRSQSLSVGQSRIPFSLEDLPSGQIDLLVGGHAKMVNLQKDILDYAFELRHEPAVESQVDASKGKAGLSRCLVEISFKAGPGQPFPSGLLAVSSYLHGNGVDVPLSSAEKDLAIRNGKATLEVVTPNELSLRADHLSGYWFFPSTEKIGDKETRHTLTIPVLPAGAIRGRIKTDDALRERGFFCSVGVIKAAKGLEGRGITSGGEAQSDAAIQTYITPPLPFGGTYAAIIWDNGNYNVSSPTLIDEEHPIVDMDIERKPGVTISGRVVDPSGKPIAKQSVRLIYDPEMQGTFASSVIMSDREGKFSIPNVNLEVPGHYEITTTTSPEWNVAMQKFDKNTVQPITITCTPRK